MITISRASLSGQRTSQDAEGFTARQSFSVPEDAVEAGYGRGNVPEVAEPLLNGRDGQDTESQPSADGKAGERADEDSRMRFAINASLVQIPLAALCALSVLLSEGC